MNAPASAREILKIERTTVLRASRSRVWRALAESSEFGKWFEVSVDGPFRPGARVTMVTQTKGYEGLTFPVLIQQVEPEHLLSWRWHPGADLQDPPNPAQMTLVMIRLEEVPEGTRITVHEEGFEHVDLAKRAKAFQENQEGWDYQLKNLERHVTGAH